MNSTNRAAGDRIARAPNRCRALFAATSLLTAFTAARTDAVPVVIDDFSTGFQLVSVNTSTPFGTSTLAAASALGGTRTLDAQLTSPTGNSDALVSPGGLGLAIGGASSTGSVNVGLHWTPGGVDLTDGGANNALVLDFLVLDPGVSGLSILFDFLFTSTLGDTSTLSVAVPAIPPNASTVLLDLASAVSVPPAGNTAFTMNQSIDLSIRMDAAADFAMTTLRTDRQGVPDGGSTLAMLGLVVTLAGGAKWRLRRLVR